MRHNVLFATAFATFISTSTFAAELPGKGITVQPVQSTISEESFQTALKNQDFFNKIQTMRDQALKDFGLEGTPTFYLNGKQLTGEKTLDQLSAEIDPLLK